MSKAIEKSSMSKLLAKVARVGNGKPQITKGRPASISDLTNMVRASQSRESSSYPQKAIVQEVRLSPSILLQHVNEEETCANCSQSSPQEEVDGHDQSSRVPLVTGSRNSTVNAPSSFDLAGTRPDVYLNECSNYGI